MSYVQYYSSSDVFIYMHNNDKVLHLDKANGIGYSEGLDSFPTYGIGDSEFAFINQGNVIVNGYIDVNLIHSDYINKAVNYIYSSEEFNNKVKRGITLKDLREMSIRQMRTFATGESESNSSKLQNITRGFSLKIVFNNSTPLRPDIGPSNVSFYECVFLDNGMQVASEQDGQIVNRYRFVAKRR